MLDAMTVMLACALSAPAVAVTSVVPVLSAVTSPLPVTVAMLGLADVHVTFVADTMFPP